MSRLSWPSRLEPEDGFTLVEVLVALGVIFATLLVLAFTMFTSLATVGFSRQRTEATSLANQAMEQIRALPFDALFMSTADTSTIGTPPVADPQLLPSGCIPLGTCTFNGRTVPMATFSTSVPVPPTTPFYPSHIATTTAAPGNTVYTVSSYVSLDLDKTTVATVQVSWTPPQLGAASQLNHLQVETKIFSSPFSESAPGATTTTTVAPVHNYSAAAHVNPGLIQVKGTVLSLNAADLELNLPTANATLGGNTGAGTTVSPVSGGTANSSLTAAGNLTVLNTPGATASASSPVPADPDGPHTVNATPGVLQTLNGSIGLNTGGINAQIVAGPSTAGAAVAAKTANNTTNIPSGFLPMNQLGYGKATATQTGLIASNISILGLLNIGLINLTPTGTASPGPDNAIVAQTGSSLVPNSQSFTASASNSFAELDVLGSGLPLLSPVVKLTGFQASASACAAPVISNCAASTAIENGSLSLLGGGSINLSTQSPGTIGIPTQNLNIGLASVAVGASVTVGSSTHSSPGSGLVTSPLTINVTLNVTLLGITLVDVQVTVTLGTVSTTATYGP